MLLTSSNLSKAAWGETQKEGSQFCVRSFECGVLIHPQYLETPANSLTREQAAFPYRVPPLPYQPGDEPWKWGTTQNIPDVFGNVLV